jgi:hypothetical protein
MYAQPPPRVLAGLDPAIHATPPQDKRGNAAMYEKPSWTELFGPAASLRSLFAPKGVDGRVKPGQDAAPTVRTAFGGAPGLALF